MNPECKDFNQEARHLSKEQVRVQHQVYMHPQPVRRLRYRLTYRSRDNSPSPDSY